MTDETSPASADADGAGPLSTDQQRQAGPQQQHGMRQTIGTLFLDAGLSIFTYLGLHWAGVNDYTALLAATVVAGLRALYVIIRRREIDAFSVFMLFVFALGLALSLITGSPRFLLIKESFGTAASGLVFLITCLVGRPLMYYAAQRFAAPTAAEREHWRELWVSSPGFRKMFTTMSVVWGVTFLIEAAVRIPLVFVLPVPVMASLSPLLTPVVIVLLMIWTFRYGARRRERMQAAGRSAAPPQGDSRPTGD